MTIRLNDEAFRAGRELAAERGISLPKLIVQLLEREREAEMSQNE